MFELVAVRQEVLADLHGVECGSLFDLVAADPESQAVVAAGVDAYASDIDGVFAGAVERHGVGVEPGFVDDDDAWGEMERCSRLVG